MKRILLLCSLVLFLLASVAYTVRVSEARVDPQTPEDSVKRIEEAAKKCAQEAYEFNLELQRIRELANDVEGGGASLGLYILVQQSYKERCWNYHFYLRRLQEARARIPTPTPTPTPITTAPTSDPQPKPRDDTNEGLVRFLREQEQKLRELRDRKNKLINEINDHLKKAKSAKPKPPTPGYKTEFDSISGLLILKFTTPEGVLRVHLPDDMRAGDTISGTVVAEPNGQTNEERTRNLKTLNRYQLKVANETMTSPWGPFTWEWSKRIPKPTPSPQPSPSPLDKFPPQIEMPPSEGENVELEIELIDLIAPVRMKLPEPPPGGRPTPGPSPTASKMSLPTIGQNGSSVEIKGPFDGNLRTTDLRIGGQPVTKLAESPRSCIFQSPEQSLGPADITLTENNVETKGTYRNLGVQLSAPKTSLLKGERTTVTIEVSGLQGIKQDVPLHLEASGVINMDGGNYQYLDIRPQDVSRDGGYTTTRAITGQQAGGFGVTATVIHSESRSIEGISNVSRAPQPFSILRTIGTVSATSGGKSLTAASFGGVKAGDTVKTGADGIAFLKSDTAEQTTLIALDHNTEISYEPEKEDEEEEKTDCPEKTTDPAEKDEEEGDDDIEVPRFDLREGSALNSVLRKASKQKVQLKIDTTMGSTGVCGTEFYTMKSADSFRIVVSESSVWMRDTEKKKITVNAMQMGFITLWEKAAFRETGTGDTEKLAEEQARLALYTTVNSFAVDDTTTIGTLTGQNKDLGDKLRKALQTAANVKMLPKVGNKFAVAVEISGAEMKKLLGSLTAKPMGKHAVGVTSTLPDGVMSRIEEFRRQFNARRPLAK